MELQIYCSAQLLSEAKNADMMKCAFHWKACSRNKNTHDYKTPIITIPSHLATTTTSPSRSSNRPPAPIQLPLPNHLLPITSQTPDSPQLPDLPTYLRTSINMHILILRTTLRSLTHIRTRRALDSSTIIPMGQKRERITHTIGDVVVGETV